MNNIRLIIKNKIYLIYIMNFENLPSEIKSKIFKINYDREKEDKEILKNKKLFNSVMHEFQGIVEYSYFYFDREETDYEINDEEIYLSIIILLNENLSPL